MQTFVCDPNPNECRFPISEPSRLFEMLYGEIEQALIIILHHSNLNFLYQDLGLFSEWTVFYNTLKG